MPTVFFPRHSSQGVLWALQSPPGYILYRVIGELFPPTKTFFLSSFISVPDWVLQKQMLSQRQEWSIHWVKDILGQYLWQETALGRGRSWTALLARPPTGALELIYSIRNFRMPLECNAEMARPLYPCCNQSLDQPWKGIALLRRASAAEANLEKRATRGPFVTVFSAAGTTVFSLNGIWISQFHVYCKYFY